MFDYIIVFFAAIPFISNSHCVNIGRLHLSISILYVITTLIIMVGITLTDFTNSDSTDSIDFTLKELTDSDPTIVIHKERY